MTGSRQGGARAIRALAVLLALAPADARAFTYTWVPQTEEGAEALRQELDHRSQRGATVRQSGQGNEAQVSQAGAGNQALVLQRGRGNSASLSQEGGGNAQVLIQLGVGNAAALAQGGGEAGVTIQIGRPGRTTAR